MDLYVFQGEGNGEYLHRIPKGDTQVLRPADDADNTVVLRNNDTEPEFNHGHATSISLYRAQLSSSVWGS